MMQKELRKDIDFDHNHGFETFMHGTGNIHQIKHQIKSLGEGRVLPKWKNSTLKFGKCAQVFPRLSSLTTRFYKWSKSFVIA